MKKTILFVMNTMGRAGAERALIEFLKKIDPKDYRVYLYVLIPRGELFGELPEHVKVLNKKWDTGSVLSRSGRRFVVFCLFKVALHRNVCSAALRHFLRIKRIECKENLEQKIEKILCRMLADGQSALEGSFDYAVAYLEGPATWYTAEKVKAKEKAAFLHVDYKMAGYEKELDQGCYEKMHKIYAVSRDVQKGFLKIYPEYKDKTEVLLNTLNHREILQKSLEETSFPDSEGCFRILTVGRLNYQKGYDIAIEAARILKEQGHKFRWYVLGEGEAEKKLRKQIRQCKVEDNFLLMGAKENPYPYLRQADLYVCSSRYEGKSIVIEEVQVLGRPIVASRCTAIEEQIIHGEDGWITEQGAEALAQGILWMMQNPDLCKKYGEQAALKQEQELEMRGRDNKKEAVE